MENALRHTDPGTAVEASVERVNGQVVFSVEDDGPGIPPELHDKVFERFFRGAGDRSGSSGLGLAIVRAVAESHHGTVTLEDPLDGRGARFVVRFPAERARSANAPPIWGCEAAISPDRLQPLTDASGRACRTPCVRVRTSIFGSASRYAKKEPPVAKPGARRFWTYVLFSVSGIAPLQCSQSRASTTAKPGVAAPRQGAKRG